MNLKDLFKKPSSKNKGELSNKLVFTFLAASFVGFLDSSYLAAKHFLGSPLTCSVIEGCQEVNESQYAFVFGIPVSLLGAIYYLIIFLLTIAYLDIKKSRLLELASLIALIGFLFSLWLLYAQLFLINAVCVYCLVSLATTTILFISGMLILKRKL